jgi:pyruvate,water dikinase
MQWWIINLDDGFRETVDGRYIRLEQIHSRPMKAVWAGMVAIPWDGPPAISGKGLASVMFQAATNPALATPFKTKYSQRNYIMVSSRFMNLQSRFGFHFCTVEALVSDRRAENYVGFSFRGGAADLSRRQARVHFLADILEERGFRVTLKEDTAAARFEGDDAAAMEEKLRLVGYLIMHTRQLDMIMAHSASVNHYGLKIRADLDRIAASEPV